MAARRAIVLAAGGTGGHVFPAQALAEELAARGHALALITDRRGQDYGDALGRVDTYRISAAGLGGGVVEKSKGLFALGLGLIQARRLLRQIDAGAVIGFGGYPSVPTMVAAGRAGLPTMIHEQNAVLGRANGLLAPRVSRIATSFAAVAGLRPGDAAKVVRTGNPVRAAVAALCQLPCPPVAAAARGMRLLVMGGSQGATALSAVVPQAVALLTPTERARLAISQQCRKADLEGVRATYRRLGMTVELATFFNDVPRRLANSHLVVGRAGASTVAELTAAGRPAILVPYPHATDDHQLANALAVAAAGGAWVMEEHAFTADALARRLASLIGEPRTLAEAAQAARAMGAPDAARRLADEVERLVEPGANGASGDPVSGSRERAA